MHYQTILAAETFIQTTSRIIEVTVAVPTPLRVVASRIYGADQSESRLEELRELNDIRRPGLISGGTVLQAESPAATLRTRSPR